MGERVGADAGDAARDRHTRQRTRSGKRVVADAGDAVVNCDCARAGAVSRHLVRCVDGVGAAAAARERCIGLG